MSKEPPKVPIKISLADYKKTLSKTVLGPSGLEYTMRRIPPGLMLELMGSLPASDVPPDKIADDPAFRKALPEMFIKLFPECIKVDGKKIVNGVSDDNSLAVDEMPTADVLFLLTELLNFSGIAGPAAEARRSFRPEPGR